LAEAFNGFSRAWAAERLLATSSVSRALAGRSRVLNEEALVACLADHNFEVVQAERLSMEELAVLFRNVE
jgi:capsular polysaccharide biosynthesis protein